MSSLEEQRRQAGSADAEPIRISGGEPGGEIVLEGNSVLRRLPASSWSQVEAELGRIAGLHDVLGVVPWTRLAAADRSVLLRHPRVRVISYPHEWCGEMLFDAALLHCKLLAALAPHGLALKDAHPWNVLFDGTKPVFVDVSSIVAAASLAELDYLQPALAPRQPPDPTKLAGEVFRLMFVPHFLVPLCFFRAGLAANARGVLWRFALNGAPRRQRLTDFLAGVSARQLAQAAKAVVAARAATKRFHTLAVSPPPVRGISVFAEQLAALLSEIAPRVAESGYSRYYAAKGEAQELDDPGAWNAKQRNAIAALDHAGIDTVLDVACNTGWYSRAAARRGRRVTALDTDDACVSTLYRDARLAGEDIVPLVADVTTPTPDRYRARGGGLLMLGSDRRLRGDAVLALGILHHLVLGRGITLGDALGRLAALAGSRLIVEFVGLDDDRVREEPHFFPALAHGRGEFGHFTLEAARSWLEARGWRVSLLASHPANRTLLVCDRIAA